MSHRDKLSRNLTPFRYGLSWNSSVKGHLLSASDDNVRIKIYFKSIVIFFSFVTPIQITIYMYMSFCVSHFVPFLDNLSMGCTGYH